MASKAVNSDVTQFVFYYYQPLMAAAITFIVLFGLATLLHSFQMVKQRTWFMIPFVIGGIFETVGYVGRALSSHQNPGPYTLTPYIIQSLLLLVAPALFAASIYMELSRIVLMINGDHALFIRRSKLTTIFVCGDVLSFLVQSSGAGLLSSGNVSSISTGNDIIIAGLFIQIIFFGLFVAAAATFHIRINKAPTSKCRTMPWEKHMLSLYTVSILIFVRSIVRVSEYIQGFDGYIIKHEVFLYVFDASMMWLAMATMNWIHPGEVKRFIRSGGAARMAEDQELALQEESAKEQVETPTFTPARGQAHQIIAPPPAHHFAR